RDARLDIFYQGRLLQELPLRMRSTTQCLTAFLAVLTVLVPAFLLYATVYHPMTGPIHETRVIPDEGPAPEKLENMPKDEPAPQRKDTGEPKKKSGRGGDPNEPPPVGVPIEAQRTRLVTRPGEPGELLAQQIKLHVPDVPARVTLPWNDEPT